MSATTFKRVFFLLSTAAFTINVNSSSLLAQTLQKQTTPAPTTSDQTAPSGITPRPITTPDRDTAPDAPSPTGDGQPDTTTPGAPESGADRFDDSVPSGTTSPDGTGADRFDDSVPSGTTITPDGTGADRFDDSVPSGTTITPDGTDSDRLDDSGPDGTTTSPDGAGVDGFDDSVPDSTGPGVPSDTDTTTPDADTTSPGLLPGASISPGRATRSGPSYIGVGGNIGLGDGDAAVGEGAFAVISKIGITRFLSLRPSVLFSDDATFLLPVTFDFIPGVTDVTEDLSGELGLRVSPFIGGGVALSTGDDSEASFLITGGTDIPLSDQVSLAATLNLTLGDDTAIGLILGAGYNF